jgi:hypothetical protein
MLYGTNLGYVLCEEHKYSKDPFDATIGSKPSDEHIPFYADQLEADDRGCDVCYSCYGKVTNPKYKGKKV